MDFNAGTIVEGQSMSQVTNELFNYILDVASGTKLTNNEVFGFKEIAIFKDGVTM